MNGRGNLPDDFDFDPFDPAAFDAALATDCGGLNRTRLQALYLERIAALRLSPPGDDWDGVWTMQEK